MCINIISSFEYLKVEDICFYLIAIHHLSIFGRILINKYDAKLDYANQVVVGGVEQYPLV